MMILVPAFTTSILPPDRLFGGVMSTSKNYANIDSVNINSVVVKYDHAMGDVFLYEVRGYFVDTSGPFAQSEASVVSIEYLNFTTSDSEFLINGSEYSTSSFDATIYDGVTPPDLMIVPVESPIIIDFKQVFVVKFELPVVIYKATGQPSVDIGLKISSFNNVTDNITLIDDNYIVSYYLKTNLLINSGHFNKDNVMVTVNDVQVDPYNMHVTTPIFDLKLYDVDGNVIYHNTAEIWKNNLIVSFTSMKIVNDYFSAVRANVAPISVIDSLFYQTKVLNFTDRNDRPLEDGSFNIERGTIYASQQLSVPAQTSFPTDSALSFSQQTNVYDENITMPYSTNINTSATEYPMIAMLIDGGDVNLWMLWIYTPLNTTDQAIVFSTFDIENIMSLATDLYFPLAITNSTLYDIQPLFSESSMQNCTAIASFTPRSWHHIAVAINASNSSANVFVDYSFVYQKTNIMASVLPVDFMSFAMNITTMNSSGWSLVAVTKNVSSSVNISYNVANIFVSDGVYRSLWRQQGTSRISYINDTTLEWVAMPPQSGVYRGVGMYLNGLQYDDYFSWVGNTIPMYGVDRFTDGFIAHGFLVMNPVEVIDTIDGHSRVMNLSANKVSFEFSSTDTTKPVWNDQGHEMIGTDENSTIEFWISNVRDLSIFQWVGTGGSQFVELQVNETAMKLVISPNSYSNVVYTNMTQWHHVRFDITRRTGFTGNATLSYYIDGMLIYQSPSLFHPIYDTAYFVNGDGSICIDAFGYWRSSWSASDIFNDMYSVGWNLQQVWPTYTDGDYTFEDQPIGTNPPDVYPAFEKQFSGIDGRIVYIDKYHKNVFNIINTEAWSSFLSRDIPIYDCDFVKLPVGYGYETKGRVAFWFYVNSSYNASKFSFFVYDNGGTPYNTFDDYMHAFAIGSTVDDSSDQSSIVYFTKNATNNIVKKSNYYLTNDTWNYLMFEWNSTGNRLDVDGRTVFHGKKITTFDIGSIIEPMTGNMSAVNLGYIFSSGSALRWFANGFAMGNQSDWIHDPATRTVFAMNSIPYIKYVTASSNVSAIWYSSSGMMDSLTFEYDTLTKHSYYPAMLSVPQINSNFTAQSMLTMNYPSTLWNDLSLYYGGFYNLTFDMNSSVGNLPIQITMDSSRYIIFPTQSTETYTILHQINVQASNLRISIWSANGNYTIQNIRVMLTSESPEFVDAFKKYVSENSVYSKSIVSHGYTMTNISTGSYYLLATTYLAEVAFFDKIVIIPIDNNFYITEPSLRQIVIEYTDQRGVHIDYNNFQTFRQIGGGYQIIPVNVFTAEIGTSVTLLSKNIFNEVVYFGSFTVTSISNYINIIAVVHSLKVYNQREDFVYGVITKDYAPQFYWSEWIAPNEVIQYRLTTGSYHVTITDELDNIISYGYNLFGDDVLIVRSVYTLESITKDINNVNTTIGNQITNVEINITNQNSAINNSIVNVDISITSMNSTLGNQLLSIDATLINVNSTINEQTTYLTTLIGNINSSITSQNIYTQSLIANVNSTINEQTVLMTTLFTNINSTILQQSANMQQYLININNTVSSMAINLSQAFFTDLVNNQTGELTGYISTTVNDQTTQILFEINNMTAFISNELINVNSNIYNQTVYLNGTFNFGFTEMMSTEVDIQYLIRKTEFSTLINWSNDVEVAGIIRLTMMNSYAYPMLVELRRGSNEENYTIYADNYISVYVPGGLYQYRLRNLLNDTFLPRSENETTTEAAIFKDFFVSNTSNYIETTFARIAIPIIPTQTGIDPASLVVAVVFIGAFGVVIVIIWYSRSKSSTGQNLTSTSSSTVRTKKEPISNKGSNASMKGRSSRSGSRRGLLP